MRIAALAGVSSVVLAGLILYATRAPIGAQLIQNYLRSRGVPAVIAFERLDASGFVARGVFGLAGDPDLTVERIEVEFEPAPPLALFAPRVRSIRLFAPHLKAALVDGRLRLGSLQALVDQSLAGAGGGAGPAIAIERGELRLATAAGAIVLRGDAHMARGRLTRLVASLQPARLTVSDLRADISGGRLSVRTEGAGLAATLDANATRLAANGGALGDLQVKLDAAGPYPGASLDGPARLTFSARAATLAAGDARVASPQVVLILAGLAHGPFDRIAFQGGGTVSTATGAWRGPGQVYGQSFALAGPVSGLQITRSPQGVHVGMNTDLAGALGQPSAGPLRSATAAVGVMLDGFDALVSPGRGTAAGSSRLTWASPRIAAGSTTLRQASLELATARATLGWDARGWSLGGPLRLKVRSADLVQPLPGGAFTQRALALDLSGEGTVGTAPARLSLQGSLRTLGGGASAGAARSLAQSVPIIATDPLGRAAIERAVQSLRVEAPSIAVNLGPRGPTVRLLRPVDLIGTGGAHARISTSGVNALAFTAGGAGLPDVALDTPAYTVGADRGGLVFAADTHLKLGFSGASMAGAALDVSAHAIRKAGVLSVSLPDCGDAAMTSFGAGPKPLVTDIKARLCPQPGASAFTLGPREWSLRTRLTALQFKAPDSEAAVGDASVRLELHGDARSGGPAGRADLLEGRIVDIALARRFEPLRFSGRADLAGGVWTGPLQLSDAAKSRPLAQVRFSHTMDTATGHADILAPRLVFARDGLQPRDLSPIGADMISNVEGAIAFTGRADWRPGGLTSSGRMTTAGLDLRSAVGAVKQVRTDMAFTSLAPLISESGQTVSASRIDAAAPLTAPSATVALKVDRISVAGAKAAIANGTVALDPIDLMFDPKAAVSGIVHLDKIDIAALIQRFNLADKVDIQAKVDGAIPFTLTNGSLRLSGGRLFAVGPGRLTIRREALTGASASAPGAPAPPGTMQTFAYQAMEDLAFDKLEAEVASQPMGRLGVLFRINGRHDPPNGGEARISLFDLLRGRAFEKPVDLPKGTPVNLVLDTSLNLDQLLADYAGRGRSEPVQPASGKP